MTESWLKRRWTQLVLVFMAVIDSYRKLKAVHNQGGFGLQRGGGGHSQLDYHPGSTACKQQYIVLCNLVVVKN